MGFFKGRPWTDQSGVEYAFAFVWGEATRDTVVDHGSTQRVSNAVRFYQHQKLNIVAPGDSGVAEILSTIESGDQILCFGIWKRRKYTVRSGEQHERIEMNVDLIIPMPLMHFAKELHESDSLRRLVRRDQNGKPDAMESFMDPKGETDYGDF